MMEAEFWHDKWSNNDIGFHEAGGNAQLVSHFTKLELPVGSRVFLPLCGKTVDMIWLRDQGYRVVGVELSEEAVKQFFAENGLQPEIVVTGPFKHYSVDQIDVFVGDVFSLNQPTLGKVDAIFDRGALVALPQDMRIEYAELLVRETSNAPQLLITFDYDQLEMDGPPFAISEAELSRHYKDSYDFSLLARQPVTGPLKERCNAMEYVWRLQQA